MEHGLVLSNRSNASSAAKRRQQGAPEETTDSTTTNHLTPYERLNHALQHEPRFAEEVALGRRVGAYKFIKDIGRGNFSKVKLATHQLTRDNVAVKIIDRARLDARAQRMLGQEVITLESLEHPNVLRLFEVIEMWNRVYLVTEFVAGGELYNKISLDGPMTEPIAVQLFGQLLSAVKYMVSVLVSYIYIGNKISLPSSSLARPLICAPRHKSRKCSSSVRMSCKVG